MEQCWAAVYDAEAGSGRGGDTTADDRLPGYTTYSQYSPQRSVSQWVRSQSPASSSVYSDPLPSNPSTRLPVPPSPSYSGVPLTPTAPRTPTTSNTLAAAPGFYSPYQEPPIARSYMIDDERLSIRTSIPESVLYPSPLQPAPSRRQYRGDRRHRQESVDSAAGYGSATWRSLTPHEDPPEYEPRKGDPDAVSPV